MCVGSNPTPVRKRFKHNEAEPSADKFCLTGTSIPDDSAKQKKTKKIAKSSGVRKVVWGWQASGLKLNRKKIPRRDMWSTNVRVGLNANFYKWMTQTVQQIKALKCKFNPIEKAHIIQKNIGVKPPGWPSGLRRQTQEIPQSRILVHECVRGFESHSCQKTFWTRWGTAFSRLTLSHWNVNWRWQSKAKYKKNRNVIRGRQPSGL